MNVAEGLIGDVKFRFVNEEGQKVDNNSNPIKVRTKKDFLRQQLKLKPGKVFQDKLVQDDVQTLYKLGLFKTVNVAFEGDATKVDLIYELQEVGGRSVNLGGGYNGYDGISVVVSYKDQNVGGVNDTLGANNGEKVREGKIGGSVSVEQQVHGWDASVGLNYTHVTIRDHEGNITRRDANNNQLSFSDTGIDDLTAVSFTATKDERDNPVKPTQGCLVTFSTEQSIPVGHGQITMNRLRGNYSQFMTVKLFNSKQPQIFALNLQPGTVVGDLPPYETFNLGGSNSIRGYDAGQVASSRSYILASAEYRFPMFPIAGGVIFADFASDLGSGDTVIGNPAGEQNKPGSGFSYGAGVRVDSPLGLIRADYGINNQGNSRVHIGIGELF